MPLLQKYASPLAIAQARRPRPIEEDIPDPLNSTSPKLARSATTAGTSPSAARKPRPGPIDAREAAQRRARKASGTALNGVKSPRTPSQGHALPETRGPPPTHRQSLAVVRNSEAIVSTSSLPDQRKVDPPTPPIDGPSAVTGATASSPRIARRPGELPRRHSQILRSVSVGGMSRSAKIRMLRQNYFRSEMQFLTALEGISSRLVAVPKPARLSALRAELALIAQDLPAEVDIPLICPATLVDGAASRSRHHRIVRLNPAEATSLNSAEKVPYLLMLEVIGEDFDFDPETQQNQELLARLISEKGKPRRRLFDTTEAARQAAIQSPAVEEQSDSVLEPIGGDLSSPGLLQELDTPEDPQRPGTAGSSRPRPLTQISSGTINSSISTVIASGIATPRTSEGPVSARASGSGGRPSPLVRAQNNTPAQADVSALADHMRTASQMLAQLELSAAKRPKTEVAAIKAKIIASMQSMEEQSFLSDDALQSPSFDAIIAKAGAAASQADAHDLDDEEEGIDAAADPNLNSGKGAARMENDAVTGSIARQGGDRDDPSAATFGEAWEVKKERIRRTSPYGWIKHWDLVSVIVKTGDDLRQEAFACQLIALCSKIFAEHGVNVWVKQMRILVMGESSGLIETITDAVSLHSIKRSLTLASIAAGTNPKKRIATLREHYIQTFGPEPAQVTKKHRKDTNPTYTRALDCFVRSLAAYSIISYILQLKDRHNGNILIDAAGHVVHIDFGFMLSNSPGNMGFEAAPFKLPLEYVELLGGLESPAMARFKDLLKDAFQALRREAERIVTLVELMGRGSRMPCYAAGLGPVVAALRARFALEKSEKEAREFVEELVAKSVGSYYTRLYDTYQYRTQGIY